VAEPSTAGRTTAGADTHALLGGGYALPVRPLYYLGGFVPVALVLDLVDA